MEGPQEDLLDHVLRLAGIAGHGIAPLRVRSRILVQTQAFPLLGNVSIVRFAITHQQAGLYELLIGLPSRALDEPLPCVRISLCDMLQNNGNAGKAGSFQKKRMQKYAP